MEGLVSVIGMCLCVSLSVILINCLRCRKKLTEEELQQKYFEKFRKKHMKARDRVLTNRVDVIRPRTDSQMSSVSCENEHTYQSIGSIPVQDSQKSDQATLDDHSFFDESFQTVVEASSYNSTNPTDCRNDGNFLSASANLASYISFHRQNSSSAPIVESLDIASTGEINPAFSDEPVSGGQIGQTAFPQDSLSDDYIIPNQGPKICITQPSIRKMFDNQIKTGREKFAENNMMDTVEQSPGCNRQKNIEGDDGLTLPTTVTKQQSDTYQLDSPQHVRKITSDLLDCVDPAFRHQYVDKLRTEGRSYYRDQTHRKNPIQKSKGKTKLVIPSATVNDPFDSSDEEHTYESITSVLAEGAVRLDSVDIEIESDLSSGNQSTQKTSNSDHTYESLMSKSCESLITSIAKPLKSETSSCHVESIYENTNHQQGDQSQKKCATDSDTGVVIIGRKVSCRYKPILQHGDHNTVNKTPTSYSGIHCRVANSFRSPAKSRRDSFDRYSPFPSSKKLAFKPHFKQTNSPRLPTTQIKSGHLIPTFFTELLNSASKSIGIENFNIETPVMKIKDSPKVFTINSTVFLSPLECKNNLDSPSHSVNENKFSEFSPQPTYLPTPMSDCNTKLSEPIRKSLPSLPDDLQLMIENHCNTGVNAMSTPNLCGQSFDL